MFLLYKFNLSPGVGMRVGAPSLLTTKTRIGINLSMCLFILDGL